MITGPDRIMDTDKTKDKIKRTYKKPRLRIIELAAEEVLAVGCKMTAGGSPAIGNAINCHAPNFCANKGT